MLLALWLRNLTHLWVGVSGVGVGGGGWRLSLPRILQYFSIGGQLTWADCLLVVNQSNCESDTSVTTGWFLLMICIGGRLVLETIQFLSKRSRKTNVHSLVHWETQKAFATDPTCSVEHDHSTGDEETCKRPCNLVTIHSYNTDTSNNSHRRWGNLQEAMQLGDYSFLQYWHI